MQYTNITQTARKKPKEAKHIHNNYSHWILLARLKINGDNLQPLGSSRTNKNKNKITL